MGIKTRSGFEHRTLFICASALLHSYSVDLLSWHNLLAGIILVAQWQSIGAYNQGLRFEIKLILIRVDFHTHICFIIVIKKILARKYQFLYVCVWFLNVLYYYYYSEHEDIKFIILLFYFLLNILEKNLQHFADFYYFIYISQTWKVLLPQSPYTSLRFSTQI